MKIWLDKDWYIDQVPNNYTVVHRKMSFGNAKNKTSEPKLVDEIVGYTSDRKVTNAFDLYIHARIKEDSENFEGNLDEYLVKMQDIINNALKGMEKYAGH